MSKRMIETFLREMRDRYQEEIDAVALPEGTTDYVRERVGESDSETVLFMLKLGYLMGLQTGYAAGSAGGDAPDGPTIPGPMQA